MKHKECKCCRQKPGWAEMANMLLLIREGIEVGHVSDASIIVTAPESAKSMPIVSLSSMIEDALKAAKVQLPKFSQPKKRKQVKKRIKK